MGRWLSSFILLFVLNLNLLSQTNEEEVRSYDKDFKDNSQFKKFYKRRNTIAAWQINQMKKGALVVRLRTNKALINGLRARGDNELATEKELETFIKNKNTYTAYTKNFNFCKLYFMYANFSDSLLKGRRKGFFLDENLKIDSSIKMTETFYLIAERDYVYNSTIGFVPEDSALRVKETGTPVREMGAVIKNKYGHQLKNPFPYYVRDKTFSGLSYKGIAGFDNSNNCTFFFSENKNELEKEKNNHLEITKWFRINLEEEFKVEKLTLIFDQLNYNLKEYFQSSPPPELEKVDAETKQFFY